MHIYTHPACLLHNPGPAHPEHPERLRAVIDALRAALDERPSWKLAPLVSDEQLLRAHSARLIADLKAGTGGAELRHLDADTLMSAGSLEAGLRAAGAICAAIDAVMSGATRRAFCAVRPPGHHSSADQAAGFCLFNPIAVGARHARAAHGIERVAIVDFDVHHGNGTQSIIADDAAVLFVSSQQSPLYPGSGLESESGTGNLVNGVLVPGAGSIEFRALWSGRLVSSLEGGYSLTALRESAVAHVSALMYDARACVAT
jgi:acetoin utilization deacetylase AcuC-like enzyme